MATLTFNGRIFATPTAATVLIDGQEVLSGQIGAGQSLDTQFEFLNVTSNGGAVSITVTSGVMTVGSVGIQYTPAAWDSSTAYRVGGLVTSGGQIYVCIQNSPAGTPVSNTAYWQTDTGFDPDGRESILINGQPPAWPATPVTPMPGGTPENPDWFGWYFEVSAGETITFNTAAG